MVNWKENNYPFKKFTEELTEEWIKQGFDKKETRKWLESGLQPTDANYARWLRDIKRVNIEWVLNYGNEEELRENYKKSLEQKNKKYINAQQWLDDNYPKEQRKNITTIEFIRKCKLSTWDTPEEDKLVGSLQLEGFSNLKSFNCGGNLLTSLKINNCPRLESLECYGNQLTNLEIKDLPRLTTLNCSNNSLTSLNVTNCSQLESLIAFDNLLTDLAFLDNFDSKKLTVLGLGDNNFPAQDLTVFSRFTNSTKLTVHNARENKVQQGIYNRFYGSLEPLKNFTKLEHLDIASTDIDSGLEYLPLKRLGFFLCKNEARPEAKVVKIYAICGNDNQLETLPKRMLGFDKERLAKYQTDFWKQKNKKETASSSQQISQDQSITRDWRDIHEEFDGRFSGRFYKREWRDLGFEYNQAKTLIDAGLNPNEWIFAWWITEKQGKAPEQLNYNVVAESKEKFSKYLEQLGRKWMNVYPNFNLLKIIKWVKRGLDSQETKRWIEIGLTVDDYELADHLKKNKFTPTQYANFKNKSVQEWVNYFFPKGKRKNIKKLNIDRKKTKPDSKKLTGSLKLEGFTSLEELDFSFNEITSLELSECPNLRNIFSNDNLLTNLDFLNDLNSEKLEEITVDSNNICPIDLTPFARFVNLKELWLGNSCKERISQGVHNRFFGSLEPLKNMSNLRILNINNTDVDSGLEYLPDSIQTFCCSFDERSESKVKVIAENLKKFGEPDKSLVWGENFVLLLGKLREESLKNRIKGQEKHQEISKQVIEQLKEENQRLQKNLQAEKEKNATFQSQLTELTNIIFPDCPYDFSSLKSEVKKWKTNDLIAQIQTKYSELEAIVTNIKKQVDEEIWEMFLEAQEEVSKNPENSFAENQVKRTRKNLDKKLETKELESYLAKQTEITQLEKQLGLLQELQLESQIEISPK